LHGVPKRIVSARGTQFILKFWESLHKTLDTHLNFSFAYHLQTNGQTKSKSDPENMLIACALLFGRSWYKSLPYVEFSWNNSDQESLKMAPFEMLYGRECQTPLF
jgi:hypothetical protein